MGTGLLSNTGIFTKIINDAIVFTGCGGRTLAAKKWQGYYYINSNGLNCHRSCCGYFYLDQKKKKGRMKILVTLLDGPNLGVMAALSFVFIILPAAALIILIYFFIKRKNKNKNQ